MPSHVFHFNQFASVSLFHLTINPLHLTGRTGGRGASAPVPPPRRGEGEKEQEPGGAGYRRFECWQGQEQAGCCCSVHGFDLWRRAGGGRRCCSGLGDGGDERRGVRERTQEPPFLPKGERDQNVFGEAVSASSTSMTSQCYLVTTNRAHFSLLSSPLSLLSLGACLGRVWGLSGTFL